jgi:hypothetical protein
LATALHRNRIFTGIICQGPEEKTLALLIIPSQIVAASFIAGVSVPLFLVALSRRPLLVRDLTMRFRLSNVLAIVLWACMILLGDELWRFDAKAMCDLLAGGLIVLSAILTTFIVWILVALGISTSLLVSLSAIPGPVEIEPWLADYGHGFGVEDVFRDRLQVLFRSGTAVVQQSRIVLAPRALLPVNLVEAAMLYFNFSKPTGR